MLYEFKTHGFYDRKRYHDRQTYHGEPDGNGEWLAGQYAVKFDDLKAMVAGVEALVWRLPARRRQRRDLER